ncbi:MAG: amidohydrolase [Leptospiraceae bacterium]|nr:amidohydrolase [Leptospiraceae bacterium]
MFPSFHSEDKSVADKSKRKNAYLDKILEISEYYKGVILGGSIVRELEGKYYYSTPIVQNINLIDWYDQNNPSEKDFSQGSSDGIYILSGLRFSLFTGEDLNINNQLKVMKILKDEKIPIAFHINSISNFSGYDDDMSFYSKLSKENDLQIVKCSGIGSHNDKRLDGRSLFATKTGLNWKVAPFENEAEIIKTLSVSSVT